MEIFTKNSAKCTIFQSTNCNKFSSLMRASRVANPGSEKLAREVSWIHVDKFAKQIELAFLYDVDWIGDGEVITDVFILDLIFRNMVHGDSDDLANGGVVEGRYSLAEFHHIDCPRFSAVECSVHGMARKMSRFDHVSAFE
jgi:hypothetical protein